MTATAILLIPGFFGYASFGPDSHPILEYFGGVRAVLQPLLPEHFIVAHEPPPTGTIDSRVASLHDAVGKLLRGELLPHGGSPFKAERVHLVGHSTGGVDARLFTNPAFSWDSTMNAAERGSTLGSIGNVVALSAPFHGTPLATNIRSDNARLLEAVRLLTMLGVFTRGDLVRLGLELAKFSPGALLDHPLAIPKAILASLSPRHFVDALVPLLFPKDESVHGRGAALLSEAAKIGRPPGISDLVATQVSAFFRNVEGHHELLGDLTVESMARRTAGLTPTDYGRNPGDQGTIFSYVSVAPPPPKAPALVIDAIRHLELIQAYVYATLYQATNEPPSMPPIVADGPAVDADARELVGEPSASDGVVPTRSQTLSGRATGIVFGDHLDVVGSYDGGPGANVMRSGADFNGDRFDALWTDIAKRLQ
jgi:triacylglycerol lipase